MKKQAPVYVAQSASGETIVRLMSRPDNQGFCKVRVLKNGALDCQSGEILPEFNLTYGILHFEKQS